MIFFLQSTVTTCCRYSTTPNRVFQEMCITRIKDKGVFNYKNFADVHGGWYAFDSSLIASSVFDYVDACVGASDKFPARNLFFHRQY